MKSPFDLRPWHEVAYYHLNSKNVFAGTPLCTPVFGERDGVAMKKSFS